MKTIIRPVAVIALALLSGVGVAMAGNSTAARLQGKVGDQLSTGQWRLQVVSVERQGAYESQFLVDPTTTQPTGTGDDVVVVRCKGGHTDEGVTLAPGAATTFVALFSVPKGMKLGELTVSLQTAFDDFPEGGLDVRVMLDK